MTVTDSSASRRPLPVVMRERSGRSLVFGALMLMALSACGSTAPSSDDATAPGAPTTGTSPATTVPQPGEATTTSVETPTTEAPAPETFSAYAVVQPGRYVTSVFEPGVVFTLAMPVFVDEAECYLYFEDGPEEAASWLGFHAAWAQLGVDEVVALLWAHPEIEIQAEATATVGGMPALRLDGISVRSSQDLYRVVGDCEWWLEAGYVWRFYVVDVNGQTVVITIEVPLDAPAFLAVAEEIIASVRFETP